MYGMLLVSFPEGIEVERPALMTMVPPEFRNWLLLLQRAGWSIQSLWISVPFHNQSP